MKNKKYDNFKPIILTSTDDNELCRDIKELSTNNDIIDIQYSTAACSGGFIQYSALILISNKNNINKDNLLNMIMKIADGTCSLQGHCHYAEAIITARKLFNRKLSPNEKQINEFINKIKNNYSLCFCPRKNECNTAKLIDKILKTE